MAADLSRHPKEAAALPPQQLTLVKQDDQLVLSRYRLADKWGIVRTTKSDHESGLASDTETAEALPDDGPQSEAVLAVSQDEPGSKVITPALIRDRRTQKIVISNFATRSFEGDQGTCFDISRKMAEDVGARDDSVEVLVDTDFMVMTRFCAANGSIVMTCRNDQITISPRRARPDDGCHGSQQASLIER